MARSVAAALLLEALKAMKAKLRIGTETVAAPCSEKSACAQVFWCRALLSIPHPTSRTLAACPMQ